MSQGNPLSIPDLLNATLRVIQLNLKPLLTVAAVVQVVSFLFLVLATLSNSLGLAVVFTVVDWIIRCLVGGVFTLALFQTARGRPVDLQICFQDSIAAAGRLVPTAALVGAAIGLGLVVLIIPGLIAFAFLALSVPAAMMENVASVEALKRSVDLSRERWKEIGSGLLAVGFVVMGGSFLLTWIVGGIGSNFLTLLVHFTTGAIANVAVGVAVGLMYQSVTGQLGQNAPQ